MKIDGIDKKIIRSLVKDARVPILSIARDVGISGAAIHQRLRKLEKSKLIDGYQMKINPEALGYTTIAFVGVFLDTTAVLSSIIKRLKEVREVVECHYTTGNFTIFIKVLCKDNEDLMCLLDTKIKMINGVTKFETFISLNHQIDRQVYI
ncbi:MULTISPECIES: Lrp/AsnC family transcriptional regulator [Polaribacter]|uniref:Lrp/AsnC ligand binding domain-containing protein n=1 Tax=Polaribacter sejongensis TaxID=985043 RepID=A0AAJ1QXZ0_9FLAO|nr:MULTISPECIES: Lrp/AsnC ligand binding domain-containing protein [Polaribacter]AUC20996.1 transcriptional regulator [Polaribacter sejongensis]MDN3619666.1 Lrp/AsnC ligand binding domain-containing protein [Polaribacter undariae]UWD31434.1 Lrp/AsnC ligand binding domain-containing protein [Polaribacter undariae]